MTSARNTAAVEEEAHDIRDADSPPVLHRDVLTLGLRRNVLSSAQEFENASVNTIRMQFAVLHLILTPHIHGKAPPTVSPRHHRL